MELNWKIQGGWGFKPKDVLWGSGGMDIFWNHTLITSTYCDESILVTKHLITIEEQAQHQAAMFIAPSTHDNHATEEW